jgi:hypothetical protein
MKLGILCRRNRSSGPWEWSRPRRGRHDRTSWLLGTLGCLIFEEHSQFGILNGDMCLSKLTYRSSYSLRGSLRCGIKARGQCLTSRRRVVGQPISILSITELSPVHQMCGSFTAILTDLRKSYSRSCSEGWARGLGKGSHQEAHQHDTIPTCRPPSTLQNPASAGLHRTPRREMQLADNAFDPGLGGCRHP